ncbi:lipase family alpha/beta hydrolase [Haladaptatus salinisoli]|uniref:lipase family alpha/beta hydrolase n=1 Tax=Haladaptatus salinisoli TaxID=2884876 RepID=UPI001D0AD774|nr:alpha/beta fold hydrolase [Haladaptatus salinisoli]
MSRFETTSTRRSFLRKSALGGSALGVAAVGAASATETPPGSEPVLLVHGYGDTGETPWWDVVRGYLVDVGYSPDDVYVLSLGDVPGTTTDSPAEYADAVGERLKAISEAHGSRVDIVAHSMGGLDSRWCVEKQGGARYVDDLVTLGTPHQGTYAAYLGLLTEGGRDMLPGSTFVERLNDGTLAEGVNYTALWSSADELIVPSEYARLPSPEFSSVDAARNMNTGYQEHIQLVYDRAVFDRYYRLLD